MATRKRTTRSTRSTGRKRTTRRRTMRYTTTRRRTPKLATRVGSAAALLLLAFYTQAGWPWRIGATLVVLVLVAGYLLWSRRGEIAGQIAEEMAGQQEDDAGQRAQGQQEQKEEQTGE